MGGLDRLENGQQWGSGGDPLQVPVVKSSQPPQDLWLLGVPWFGDLLVKGKTTCVKGKKDRM